MISLTQLPLSTRLVDALGSGAGTGDARLSWQIYWLGQAGFALVHGGQRILIDPYLSDSLAEKYVGKEFPHVRMMPSPVDPRGLHGIDYVLCTHAHSDHMDPGTLPVLADASPACRFVVPRAEQEQALKRGVPPDRMIPVHADDCIELGGGTRLAALPSAHEQLRRDANGNDFCLGYVLCDGNRGVYHSGDTLEYPGLADRLSTLRIDVALLPVNGRDEFRTSRGVLGNVNFEEAVDLCRRAGMAAMIPHHFGMFAENTIDERELEEKIAALDGDPVCVKPEVGQWIEC